MSIDNATAAEWDALNRAAKEMTPKTDVINPSHYKGDGIECIDYIEQCSSDEEFTGYLRGNVQKYLHRYKSKGGVQDLKKAQWYMNRLAGHAEAVAV